MCIGHQAFLLRIFLFFLNLTFKESIARSANLRNHAEINLFSVVLKYSQDGRFRHESTTTKKNTIQQSIRHTSDAKLRGHLAIRL